MSKVCSMCFQDLDEELFAHSSKAKDGRQSRCKDCSNSNRMESYYASHSYELDLKRNAVRKLAKRNRQLVDEYLLTHPCVDCGISDPIVLEFDHVTGIKKDNVGNLITKASMQLLVAEMLKCQVRCANCHRRKTYFERH